jgi:hypothetical protein
MFSFFPNSAPAVAEKSGSSVVSAAAAAAAAATVHASITASAADFEEARLKTRKLDHYM